MHSLFEIYNDKSGEYRFRIKSVNNQIILSSEGYTSKQNAENAIASVQRNSKNPENFVRKLSKDGRHYFVIKAGNGKIIGKSPRYKSKTGLEGVIKVLENSDDLVCNH